MTNKLQQYFPMIRTREEVLNEIESKSRLKNLFYDQKIKGIFKFKFLLIQIPDQ